MKIELDDGSTMDISSNVLFKKDGLEKAKILKYFTGFVAQFLDSMGFRGLLAITPVKNDWAILFLDEDAYELEKELKKSYNAFLDKNNVERPKE